MAEYFRSLEFTKEPSKTDIREVLDLLTVSELREISTLVLSKVDIPIQQSYLWYGSSIGDKDPQASGTYIFRPDGALQTVASRSVPLKIVRGPLVDLVHQQFNLWIYQRHNCGFSWRERQWEVDSDEPGEVLIDGINLKKLQFVSQELILFTTTIKENIAYGKAGATLEEIRTVTEIANARRFRDKMPHFTCLYFFFFFFVNSCYSQKDVVCGRLGKEDICSFLGKLIVLLILC
ncbi:ABC transporter B family member 3-like isoform X3 [Magnolia sinica]|nr:ABC transporter B family member 3-like isoform X3 [Magnolia sinica]